MMNKKTIVILEILWIVIGIFCIAAAIHNNISGHDNNRSLILTGMGIVAFIMAYVRDRQRRKK